METLKSIKWAYQDRIDQIKDGVFAAVERIIERINVVNGSAWAVSPHVDFTTDPDFINQEQAPWFAFYNDGSSFALVDIYDKNDESKCLQLTVDIDDSGHGTSIHLPNVNGVYNFLCVKTDLEESVTFD